MINDLSTPISDTVQEIRSLESQILDGQAKYRKAALQLSLLIAKYKQQQQQH